MIRISDDIRDRIAHALAEADPSAWADGDDRPTRYTITLERDAFEEIAAAVATPPGRARREAFAVQDGHLVRYARPARGGWYEHRCRREDYERIAHAIEECDDEPFSIETLAHQEDMPWTRVAVALAFLKDRGIIATRHRRNYAATGSVHLDAMTEYYALAEPA